MLKKLSVAVLAVAVFSANTFAQDAFISFAQGSAAATSSDINGLSAGDTGTAFIYTSLGFDVTTAIDLVIESTDSSSAVITSGVLLNSAVPTGLFGDFVRWTTTTVVDDPITSVSSIGFQATNFGSLLPGVTPSVGIDQNFSTVDEDFDADANAFLLGTFDFQLTGDGPVSFVFGGDPATNGFFVPGSPAPLNSSTPGFSFRSASVNAPQPVPEPSAYGLFALGFVGVLARRRR